VRIATRKSALALWQAEFVAARLGVVCELVVIETHADQRLDIPIWEMGGKGVFVKEIQAALLDGRADLAVHSGKDLPAVSPDELEIGAVPLRADPRDVLVGHAPLASLPESATIATGSVRRKAQLANLRPDLRFEGLRGNIATRLDKVPPGGAIVMAAAALDRLGLMASLHAQGLIADTIPTDVMLPQVAQGALVVERRADAPPQLVAAVAAIEDPPSRRAVEIERSFLRELGGDCNLPAGCFATVQADGAIDVRGLLAALDGSTILRHQLTDVERPDVTHIGAHLARHLLDHGGADLLARSPS